MSGQAPIPMQQKTTAILMDGSFTVQGSFPAPTYTLAVVKIQVWWNALSSVRLLARLCDRPHRRNAGGGRFQPMNLDEPAFRSGLNGSRDRFGDFLGR